MSEAAVEDNKMETGEGVEVEEAKALVSDESNVENNSGDMDVTAADGDEKGEMLKAAKQIEFYFADSNLPFDKFMWTLYTKDPDHWVPVETVASFKRMRDFSARGVEWVAKALRLSEDLEVNEDGSRVRRRTEVQEPKGQFERSVYAKGFPDEEPTLQVRLEEFFNGYGKTNAVRMRRDEGKKFKNSVFAEFTDFKSVDKFLAAEPKPSWEGKELLIMTKEAYCDMKIKEKGLTGKAANNRKDLLSRTRGFNAFKEMARAKASAAKASDKKPDGPKPDVFLDFMGSKILIHEDASGNGSVKEEDVPFVKGATLKFDGCGGDVTWSEIKDPIKEKFDGRAPFIKYARGDNSGLVGFHKALSEADKALVKDTIKSINSNAVTWSVPEEEEEKLFQIERAQAAAKAVLGHGSGGDRRTRDGGRGGRGGGRGRGGRDGGRGGGGRGGGGRGRGGRGGRGGGRDKGGRNAEADEASEEQAGEKRKRAVEPDGGPDVGVRGAAAPPVIQSAKKVKTDGGETASAS